MYLSEGRTLSRTTHKNDKDNKIRSLHDYLGVRVVGQVDGLPPALRSKSEVHAGAIEIHPVQKGVCSHQYHPDRKW